MDAAKTYFDALVAITAKDDMQVILAGLEGFVRFSRENSRITHSMLPVGLKRRFLNTWERSSKPSAMLKKFVRHIVLEKKVLYIDDILKYCKLECDNIVGVRQAIVESAVSLTDNQHGDIVKFLEKRTGKTVKICNPLNGKLLSGFRIILDGMVLDCSLYSKIQSIRKRSMDAIDMLVS